MIDFLGNPVIFFGTGRSGSTIISEIVLKHASFAFPSNYHHKFPKNEKVNYLRYLFDNRLWRIHGMQSQVKYNKVKPYNKFLFIPSEAWNMWDQILPNEIPFTRGFLNGYIADNLLKENVRSFFLRMVQLQGRERLGFQITGPGRLTFLQSIFPDACFVHIKRRIVPTISSFLQTAFWQKQGIHQLWWKGPYSPEELLLVESHLHCPVWMTAFQLKKILYTIELEKIDLNTSRVIDFDYDEFIVNPESVILPLLKELNLSDEEDCMSYLQSLRIAANGYADDHYFDKGDLSIINNLFIN